MATITVADSLLSADQTLYVDDLDQSGSNNLHFDASRERQGGFDITGTGHDDVLIGGGGDDTLDGVGRRDVIQGNGGQDVLSGGHAFGQQAGSVFIFASVGDSTVDHPDEILDLGDDQRIDLHRIDARTDKAGDQAFKLVEAFTGHSGQLVVGYDSAAGVTDVSGDVDGDGAADFRIMLDGGHSGFSHFSL
jgi:hypothetical protein